MKAQYNLEKLESVDCLTFGKMYDVLDITTHRTKIGVVEKIKIKNDSGKESWYTAGKFILHAEAAAYLSNAAAGAGENAAQSATPDGSQVFIGIDIAAGRVAREIRGAEKNVMEGLQVGMTTQSDARKALERQIRERAASLMFGA